MRGGATFTTTCNRRLRPAQHIPTMLPARLRHGSVRILITICFCHLFCHRITRTDPVAWARYETANRPNPPLRASAAAAATAASLWPKHYAANQHILLAPLNALTADRNISPLLHHRSAQPLLAVDHFERSRQANAFPTSDFFAPV